MILYEASMRCTYCGTRMFHKLRADEVVALQQKKPLKRPCEFCAGLTEWELLNWKGNPPSVALNGVESDTSGTSTGEGHPPDRILVIDDDDLTTILLGKVLAAPTYTSPSRCCNSLPWYVKSSTPTALPQCSSVRKSP